MIRDSNSKPFAQLNPSTLVSLLRFRARHQLDQRAYTFLVDGETEAVHLTYGELDQNARAIGAWLQSLGATGERALLLYPPGLGYIAAFFGCLYAGVVAVPTYPPGRQRRLPRIQAIVADVQARFALTTAPIRKTVERLREQAPELKMLQWLVTDDVMGNVVDDWQVPEITGDTLAFLQYTSGSTGTPKGVMLSHGNLLHNQQVIKHAFGHTGESIVVGWLPLYHDMGLIGNVMQPLYMGIPYILMSPLHFLQYPLRWLDAISRYKATTSGGPNFAYDLCVRKIPPSERAGLDLSCWRVAFNGAEPVHAATLDRFVEAFSPCGFRREAFYPCYGLAEATLLVSGGSPSAPPVVQTVQGAALEQKRAVEAGAGREGGRALVGCGRTVLDQQIVIVHPEALTPCSEGEVGEIWVKGPSVAQGYWNRPVETEQTFLARLSGTGEGPYLRTGDLGFLKDGELFVTGRLKDLIISRGRNHYPQDIELTVEQSHPALRPGGGVAFSVEVSGEERLVVVQEVEYRQQPDIDEVASAIRRAVAEEHEVTVYAVVLIKPGTLPMTSSGKKQRHACRAKFLAGSLDEVGRSLLNQPDSVSAWGEERLTRELLLAIETEERWPLLMSYLAEQVARVLKVGPSRLDLKQPLIALGLDSLMAFELKHRIETDFGVVVPLENFLEGHSVEKLATQVLSQVAAAAEVPSAPFTLAHQGEQGPQPPPLAPIPRDGDLPLSFEQERLWFLDQLVPGNPAYNIPAAFRLKGRLNIAVLSQSFDEIVQRHEALRTTFSTVSGRPIQVIAKDLTVTLPVVDLQKLPETEREAFAQRLATAVAKRPFDLAQGPLIRAILLRLGDKEHRIIFTLHHIISDVWSLVVLREEVVALYDAFSTGVPSPLDELSIQYADFAHWQQQWLKDEALDAQLSYWKQQLANAPPGLELPTDRPRPDVQSFRGASHSFKLSKGLSESLRELSRKEGVTLFMALLAAFKAVLHRYSGQEDILVGAPVSGRTHPETKGLMGFFAYPLALRTNMSGNPTFRELLARVREVTLGAYAHQEAPFAKVIAVTRQKRNPKHRLPFQVMFGFLDKPMDDLKLSGLQLSPVDVGKEATDFDLFLTLFRGTAGLHGVLEYKTNLFDASTMEQLMGFYCQTLKKCVQQPEVRLAQFELPEALEAKTEATRTLEQKQMIAIAATFTAEPVEESLRFWMSELDLPFKIAFAPYNQVFQQLLDPSTLLSKNEKGINVLLVRFEDWQRFEDRAEAGANPLESADEKMERNVRDLVLALKSAAAGTATPYLVFVCPASPAALADANRAALFQQLEDLMVSELDGVPGVYLVTTEELAATYPVSTYYDPHGDELGHIPYIPLFFTALGTMIARKIDAIHRAPYKVIVLDADQTLWKGVCGEDGALGIEIDEPRKALQEFMVAQHDAGRLLCLCSKNNETDVLEVFERRREMPLQRNHLVAWRINWKPKSENLKSLAEELQLGLDSFIFIDDNPVECAEVMANCPEVLTLQLPEEPGSIPTFLNHVWAFDQGKITKEDRKRTALYKQHIARARFRRESFSLKDFLEGLGLEVQISELQPSQLERVSQLTQRTNQLNFTTRRRSEGEIQKFCDSGKLEGLVVFVRDRFGDYGLVGVIMFEAWKDAITVDTFLLSCRTLGRGVEHRMLACLGEIAKARGLDFVDVCYIPTPKNQPALDFLESIGAPFKHPFGEGFLFRFTAEFAATLTQSPPV